MKLNSLLPRIACILMLLSLGACATAPGRTRTDDPWQGYNRTMYKINDTVDRATLKPVTKGYQKITPSWMRTGVRNFFANLGTPWVMVNELLQGKPKAFAQETGRLVINSTLGLAGFIDVATKMNLEAHDEDFGQTLAVWGVPSGPFVTLPVFGPSTVRDGLGRIPDFLANPTRQADLKSTERIALTAADVIQTRESLLSLDSTIAEAYDPYAFVRDAWTQRRVFKIYDGNPPVATDDNGYDLPEDDTATSESPTAPAAATNGDHTQHDRTE